MVVIVDHLDDNMSHWLKLSHLKKNTVLQQSFPLRSILFEKSTSDTANLRMLRTAILIIGDSKMQQLMSLIDSI